MLDNDKLSQEIAQLKVQNKKIQEEISSIKISASYKLAQEVVSRCKTKIGIVTLPFYLINQFFFRKLTKFIRFKGAVPRRFSETDCRVSLEFTQLEDGVSILIPCYRGEQYIERCLNSIANQSINQELIEIVIVLNGNIDRTPELISSFQLTHPDFAIYIEHIQEANVSSARNRAIECANKQYSIFLDVDDELSPNYLKNLLSKSKVNTVVFTNIKDVYSDAEPDTFFTDKKLKNINFNDVSFDDVLPLVSKNACKLIPTHFLKQLTYCNSLKSGEDVVFMSQLFSKLKPQIELCNDFHDTFYIRHVVENSVSRKASSYQFCVEQRLDVIEQLDKLLKDEKHRLSQFILTSFINFQLNFIASYLLNNRNSYQQLMRDNRLNKIEFDVETAINRKN